MRTVVAAYCYSKTASDHKVIIVTSSTGKWIIPKGRTEKRKSKREVAILEAWEEAGVIGMVTGKAQNFRIRHAGLSLWKIYPVKILRLEQDWPEAGNRKRRLVSLQEALSCIEPGDLATALSGYSPVPQ